ncbi:MAG: ATP-binding protein [Deltaproteobacteria bacterium]|nr:ATP-binding protein [Deltaproteobacteria bacterium]
MMFNTEFGTCGKGRSIKSCLKKAPIFSSFITAVILFVSLNGLFFSYYLENLKSFGHNLTSFIANQIGPDLFLGNHDTVKSFMESIVKNPEFNIAGARVYNIQNSVIFEHQTAELTYEFVERVYLAGKPVGLVKISISKSNLWNFVKQSIFVCCLLLMLVFGLGCLISGKLYKRISGPLDCVLQFLEQVKKEKDYSKRLQISSPLEFQILAAGVNEMLKEIQQRDDNLERLVIERTHELLKKQKELRSALTQLERLSEARNRFLANISHEIRTPLNALCLLSEELWQTAINNPEKFDGKLQNDIELIKNSTSLLLGLVNDLLDFSRIINNRFDFVSAPFDLIQTFKSSATLFVDSAKAKGIELILHKPTLDSLFVVGDQKRFSQVIINVLSNAIKFTDRGHVKANIAVSVDDHFANVILTVQDTGVGIPKEKIEAIFEPFVQVDDSYTRRQTGVGLGLSIVKEIVKHYNGKIELKSEEGQGTTFHVHMRFKIHSKKVQVSDVDVPNFTGRTILVVEDNPINSMLVERLLQDTKAEIRKANNGLEAIEALKQRPRTDIILMDIQMPIMDGVEATKKLRSMDINIPIIALTAHAFPEELQKYLEIGCDAVLTKPINKQELYEKIKSFLT